MTDSLKFGTVYPQQRRIANTAQNHHRTSRMLEICQSGICGRPGRATARVDPAVGVLKQRRTSVVAANLVHPRGKLAGVLK